MADCTFYGRKSKFRLHNLSEFIASLPFTVEQLPFEDIFREKSAKRSIMKLANL